MRRRFCLPVLLLAPVLAGCFDISETLEVSRDGEAQFVLTAAFERALYPTPQSQRDAEQDCQATDDPSGAGLTVSRRSLWSDAAFICAVTVRTTDWPALTAKRLAGMTLTKAGPRQFRFAVDLAGTGKDASLTTGQSFKGHRWTVLVRALDIVDTNGTVAPDHKSVTWETPMAAVFDATTPAPEKSFWVVARYR